MKTLSFHTDSTHGRVQYSASQAVCSSHKVTVFDSDDIIDIFTVNINTLYYKWYTCYSIHLASSPMSCCQYILFIAIVQHQRMMMLKRSVDKLLVFLMSSNMRNLMHGRYTMPLLHVIDQTKLFWLPL